ncbi:probable sodium/metabolite cotransporter BASS3, chloroplastic [Lotus japonicus]|uniref:probable sodium/metabolite cotransporter BASS3, chloroplastic n=1 Tax=Lotus japonicus TaxID=34305 RepID=UPI00258FD418|nr:probable sodium/metabolite cotransporter BASS3, chloroplastic [Lotus japonicus]
MRIASLYPPPPPSSSSLLPIPLQTHLTSQMASIPVPCRPNLHLPPSQPLFHSRSRAPSPASFPTSSLQRGTDGGAVSSLSWQLRRRNGFCRGRQQGKPWLLSFRVDDGNAVGEEEERDLSQTLSALLPFVVAATAVAALAQPSTFTWVSKDLYAPALGGIMLSIGIRLSIDDFALAFKRPLPLSIGFIAQYVLKPALGVLIGKVFGLSRMFYAGFVLTACVSGAQLSSYANFISKGDVALGILLTSYTTIASVIFTPLLTGLLISSVVPIDAVAMSKSILQVVLAPVTLGLLLNTYAKPVVSVLQPVMPFVAMICTSLCIGSPLSINRSHILSGEGLRLVFPVLLFHAAAFTLGYWFSNIPYLRQEEQVSRTISLCTGMQSSTLAGLLATQFLGSTQAVPAACSVVAMAIMGLCLASFWGGGYVIRDVLSFCPLRTNSAVKA